MFDSRTLNGKTALVTGGGTGIGLAIARGLANAGASVAIAGRRTDVLDSATASSGGALVGFEYDVTHVDDASSLLSRIASKLGRVNILVNNAGIHLKKSAERTGVEEFREILNTHMLGAHALSAASIPGMREHGGGTIIFIASMASLIGIPNVFAYSAAKTGYLGMVRALAVENGSYGITVNAIAPGWIDSEMMRKALDSDPDRKKKILMRTPMEKFGQPEDVANAAVFLASPLAAFITGSCLPVDGGAAIGF